MAESFTCLPLGKLGFLFELKLDLKIDPLTNLYPQKSREALSNKTRISNGQT